VTTAVSDVQTRGTVRRRFAPRRLGGHFLDLVLVVVGLAMIMPIIWLIVESLTVPAQAFSAPPRWIPSPITLKNFSQISALIPIGRMAMNSVIVSAVATAGVLLTSSLAAYAFSRIDFAGRDKLFGVLLAALMVPSQITVIPVFILMRRLQLVDTLWAVILPLLINVFGIFFLRQYFGSIPRELDEAAKIDGAGHLWILFRMLIPLSAPAVSALSIFVLEASWNGFFYPLIFLNSTQNMTLPLGLWSLGGARGGAPAVVIFAAVTAVVLPLLAVFVIFQRSFIASIATTGLRV
jgi:multiple sugar transport system permease protein